MQIHYLVLAHHRPDRFGALISAVCDGGARATVHIDAASALTPFRVAAKPSSGVTFLPDAERVKVRWGGWTPVEATIRALRRAVDTGMSDGDYAILLSGDSYPLQAPQRIESYLTAARSGEFMSAVPIPSVQFDKPIERISRFRVNHDPRTPARPLIPRAINRLRIPLPYQRALDHRQPFAGSQWWGVTGRMARWLLDETDRDRRFVRFARVTTIPDEFFFQTLAYNSPFRQQLRPTLMFADWSRPAGLHPAPIDADHVEMLETTRLVVNQDNGQAEALFARKILDEDAEQLIRTRLWPLELDRSRGTQGEQLPVSNSVAAPE